MAGVVAGLSSRWGSAARCALAEFFWLGAAERAARSRPSELVRATRARITHAVRTMRAAERAESIELKLELARAAVCELDECWPAEAPSKHGALLRAAESTPPGGQREYASLERLFTRLERREADLTVREVWLIRWLRCSALLAFLAASSYYALAPTNIALGERVTASTTCGSMPPAALGKDALDRLVDGRREEPTFAVCTEFEAKPWVQVDLGRLHRIDRVVAYPRTDCCFGEQELPVSVELSRDGQHFEKVAARARPATTNFPWRFSLRGRDARYVRISTNAKEPTRVVLGELEVYGR